MPTLIKRLENLLENPFQRLSYTEAIEVPICFYVAVEGICRTPQNPLRVSHNPREAISRAKIRKFIERFFWDALYGYFVFVPHFFIPVDKNATNIYFIKVLQQEEKKNVKFSVKVRDTKYAR